MRGDLSRLKRLAEFRRGWRRRPSRSQTVSTFFTEFQRRSTETSNSEWKRNKVLAWTKSERDGRIIPVLLTAPPQSVRPAFCLFHPPPYPLPFHRLSPRRTQQALWVSFHPLVTVCRLRPPPSPFSFFPLLLGVPIRRQPWPHTRLCSTLLCRFSSFLRSCSFAREPEYSVCLSNVKEWRRDISDFSRNRTTTMEISVGKLRAKKEFHSYLPSFISGYGTM